MKKIQPKFSKNIPLSLYIHFPWCAQKCPYCDFNSHVLRAQLPEQEYIETLLKNLQILIPKIRNREIISIFMGGGTPSLFSATSLNFLLTQLHKLLNLRPNIEITLEANPGTIDLEKFKAYFDIGINRLSLGIQSFNDEQLKKLGRIHDSKTAHIAIKAAIKAGFKNFNLDIMYALPQQTALQALDCLNSAISYNPEHISWYQLTIEPNTFFYRHPPAKLPNDDEIYAIEELGRNILNKHNYQQYEVSAYTKAKTCLHNLNYWQFGDYLAIGAGAHGKITDFDNNKIWRYMNHKSPKIYMDTQKGFINNHSIVYKDDIAFEFMLNSLRLKHGVPRSYFSERTGLSEQHIKSSLEKARNLKLLDDNNQQLVASTSGYKFLNNLTSIFLPS